MAYQSWFNPGFLRSVPSIFPSNYLDHHGCAQVSEEKMANHDASRKITVRLILLDATHQRENRSINLMFESVLEEGAQALVEVGHLRNELGS